MNNKTKQTIVQNSPTWGASWNNIAHVRVATTKVNNVGSLYACVCFANRFFLHWKQVLHCDSIIFANNTTCIGQYRNIFELPLWRASAMVARLASFSVPWFCRNSTALCPKCNNNQGNEGVQVKEGTIDTIIEDNNIYMQLDAESGGGLLALLGRVWFVYRTWSFPIILCRLQGLKTAMDIVVYSEKVRFRISFVVA